MVLHDGSDSSGGPGATTITSGQQQQVDDDDIDNDDMDPGIIALIVIASVLVLAGVRLHLFNDICSVYTSGYGRVLQFLIIYCRTDSKD